MILLKTQQEIELIRDSARLLGETLAEVGRHIRPGVTTAFLDNIGEQYIRDNGHLPDVPSAAEVEDEGLSLGEMNKVLMQKVEELTLHVIELQKQIDELKKERE